MMAVRNIETIYNKIHSVELKDSTNLEKRTVGIIINKEYDNSLLLKLRDTHSYLFSYSVSINRNNFLQIKREQSLDIDFDEFETHLLEMLHLNSINEMLLKCEIFSDSSKCKLIFYEKSRIKDLVFLIIELMVTDQREVFLEMENNFKQLQETNKNLKQHIKFVAENLKEKEMEVMKHNQIVKELKQKFRKDVEMINDKFSQNLFKVESILLDKMLGLSCRIHKVTSNVSIVRSEANLKSESNSRLTQRIHKLEDEICIKDAAIKKLERDCEIHERTIGNLDNEIYCLKKTKNEHDKQLNELEKKMEEYRKDLENSAVIIAEKTELHNELRRDMEQASQVIKNYNKHYDAKAQEVEELKEAMKYKDALINEQITQNNQIYKEFQEYKLHFNREETDKLLDDLKMSGARIEALEKDKREMIKLNELLTRKLSSTNLFC